MEWMRAVFRFNTRLYAQAANRTEGLTPLFVVTFLFGHLFWYVLLDVIAWAWKGGGKTVRDSIRDVLFPWHAFFFSVAMGILTLMTTNIIGWDQTAARTTYGATIASYIAHKHLMVFTQIAALVFLLPTLVFVGDFVARPLEIHAVWLDRFKKSDAHETIVAAQLGPFNIPHAKRSNNASRSNTFMRVIMYAGMMFISFLLVVIVWNASQLFITSTNDGYTKDTRRILLLCTAVQWTVSVCMWLSLYMQYPATTAFSHALWNNNTYLSGDIPRTHILGGKNNKNTRHVPSPAWYATPSQDTTDGPIVEDGFMLPGRIKALRDAYAIFPDLVAGTHLIRPGMREKIVGEGQKTLNRATGLWLASIDMVKDSDAKLEANGVGVIQLMEAHTTQYDGYIKQTNGGADASLNDASNAHFKYITDTETDLAKVPRVIAPGDLSEQPKLLRDTNVSQTARQDMDKYGIFRARVPTEETFVFSITPRVDGSGFVFAPNRIVTWETREGTHTKIGGGAAPPEFQQLKHNIARGQFGRWAYAYIFPHHCIPIAAIHPFFFETRTLPRPTRTGAAAAAAQHTPKACANAEAYIFAAVMRRKRRYLHCMYDTRIAPQSDVKITSPFAISEFDDATSIIPPLCEARAAAAAMQSSNGDAQSDNWGMFRGFFSLPDNVSGQTTLARYRVVSEMRKRMLFSWWPFLFTVCAGAISSYFGIMCILALWDAQLTPNIYMHVLFIGIAQICMLVVVARAVARYTPTIPLVQQRTGHVPYVNGGKTYSCRMACAQSKYIAEAHAPNLFDEYTAPHTPFIEGRRLAFVWDTEYAKAEDGWEYVQAVEKATEQYVSASTYTAIGGRPKQALTAPEYLWTGTDHPYSAYEYTTHLMALADIGNALGPTVVPVLAAFIMWIFSPPNTQILAPVRRWLIGLFIFITVTSIVRVISAIAGAYWPRWMTVIINGKNLQSASVKWDYGDDAHAFHPVEQLRFEMLNGAKSNSIGERDVNPLHVITANEKLLTNNAYDLLAPLDKARWYSVFDLNAMRTRQKCPFHWAPPGLGLFTLFFVDLPSLIGHILMRPFM